MSDLLEKPSLIETSDGDIFKVFQAYADATSVNEWSVIKILSQFVGEYEFDGIQDCKDRFSTTFGRYLANMPCTTNKYIKRVESLKKAFPAVLKTMKADKLIQKRITELKKDLYVGQVEDAVYNDKATALPGSSIVTDSSEQVISFNFGPSTKSQGKRKAVTQDLVSTPTKRSMQTLKVKDIKDLSTVQQIQLLIKHFGNKICILDLTIPNVVPIRFKNTLSFIAQDLKIPLTLVVKKDERNMLLELSKSVLVSDIVKLVSSIPLIGTTSSFTYIRLALTKLLVLWDSDLLNYDHKETWYQVNVYSDLFDSVFLFDKQFVAKRSECHSAVIKALKKIKAIPTNAKDMKVDLLYHNKCDLGDVFSCEDKSASATEADIEADIEKGRKLREMTLYYWSNILPSPICIEELEVFSGQFFGLNFTLYGSKMFKDGNIIHYQKAKASIPSSGEGNTVQLAHFLLVIISLKRNVVLKALKLKTMLNVSLADKIAFLSTELKNSDNNIFFREDSPSSVSSEEESFSSTTEEYDDRIKEAIEDGLAKISFEKDMLTGEDWEELLSL